MTVRLGGAPRCDRHRRMYATCLSLPPQFSLHGHSLSPRSLPRLQSNRLNIRYGRQKRLNQTLPPANPLRPTYNTLHGNNMRIRKQGWFARERMQRR